MDLPELGKGVEEASNQAKNLIPWLPDPHTCSCGVYTDATVEYVERQAMPVKIWKCPSCGSRYYRDRE